MKGKKIYISGKISGLPYSVAWARFAQAEFCLKGQGYRAVNPMRNGLLPEALWQDHMAVDIANLLTCDHIYMLSGWLTSRGARIEHNIALETGLEITYEMTAKKTISYERTKKTQGQGRDSI